MVRPSHPCSRSESGFTLLEALLAVILIALIATIAISQYTDFSLNSKNSATRESLHLIRTGLQKQFTQQKLRCGLFASYNAASGYTWPTLSQVNNNDITSGNSPCDTTEIPNQTDRYFVAGAIPANPWSHPYCNEIEKRTVKAYAPIPFVNTDIGAQGITAADSRVDETGKGKQCGWVYDSTNGILKTGTNMNGESVY